MSLGRQERAQGFGDGGVLLRAECFIARHDFGHSDSKDERVSPAARSASLDCCSYLMYLQ